MPLRVELKPFERLVIGDSVIINSGTRTCFLVDGATPILREKDTVTAETANTTAKRLYLCVQTMYLKNDATRQRERYLDLIKELQETDRASFDHSLHLLFEKPRRWLPRPVPEAFSVLARTSLLTGKTNRCG
jgi:flagellar protein FlbT